MSAGVTALTASPTTVAQGGGTSKITPTISGLDSTANVKATLGTSTVSIPIICHAAVKLSTDTTLKGQPNVCVLEVDAGGTLAVSADGSGWVFTAS